VEVVLYNSLGWTQTRYVRVSIWTQQVSVTDGAGNLVRYLCL
jgi:hypothetical protein